MAPWPTYQAKWRCSYSSTVIGSANARRAMAARLTTASSSAPHAAGSASATRQLPLSRGGEAREFSRWERIDTRATRESRSATPSVGCRAVALESTPAALHARSHGTDLGGDHLA